LPLLNLRDAPAARGEGGGTNAGASAMISPMRSHIRPVRIVLVLATIAGLAGCSPGTSKPTGEKEDFNPELATKPAAVTKPAPPPPPPPPPESFAEHRPRPKPMPSPAPGGSTSQPPATVPSAYQTPVPPVPRKPAPASKPVETAPPAPLPVRLSAGVALAQTTLEGTMMSFSIDYRVVDGVARTGSSQAVWVIERAKGSPLKKPRHLERDGNLMTFAPEWRPEDGPFETHFEDPSGHRISESIPLHSP
jgi:hypothetical protein